MKRLHTGKPARFLRTTALFLALLVLGISGGTTLTHSDELGLGRVHAGAQAVSHAVPLSADTCAACQWENSLFSAQVPGVPLPVPIFALLPKLSVRFGTRSLDPFDHTSPRAPPCAA